MSRAWDAESEGYRVVYDKDSTFHYAYRARIMEGRSLIRRRPRWWAVIDQHFMGWREGYSATRRRSTRAAAEADADAWLDAKTTFDGAPHRGQEDRNG